VIEHLAALRAVTDLAERRMHGKAPVEVASQQRGEAGIVGGTADAADGVRGNSNSHPLSLPGTGPNAHGEEPMFAGRVAG
jgi:hypothetical protein